jgi:signal transduction histidine kinase
MRDRIAAVGGKFEIRSTPGAGTMIVATIPAPAGY